MKLRNKKTGEKVESYLIIEESGRRCYADSLKELCDNYEDYTPVKPKLNGEVREIVRHWANLHGYDRLRVGFDERDTQRIFWVESPDTRKHIEFLGAYVADDFDAGEYTIAELCGEEEE